MEHPVAPSPVVVEVWRQYKRLARTRDREQKRLERSRRWAVWLGLVGTVAGSVASLPVVAEGARPWLGVASAMTLAAGAFVARELLVPERETAWVRCRLVAEALKREALRAMMKVAPYDGIDADDVLVQTAQRLRLGAPAVHLVQTLDAEDETPVAVDSPASYLELRGQEQLGYYRRATERHQGSHDRRSRFMLGLGLLTALSGALVAVTPELGGLVPLLSAVTAGYTALTLRRGDGALAASYGATADELSLLLARWQAAMPTQPGGVSAMVEEIEGVLARENGSWQAAMLDPKQVEEAHRALDRLLGKEKPQQAGDAT
jgi:hypothetical protein